MARWWGSRGLDRILLVLPLALTVALWFLVPAATVGLTAWMFVLYAGYRTGSGWLKFWGYTYLALAVLVFTAGRAGYPVVGGISFLILLFAGGLHSAFAGRRVWYAVRSGEPASPQSGAVVSGQPDPAITRARWVLERRRHARRILEEDPAMGQELRIGRPDQPRSFDDGGLVDINHVPAHVLASALELPADVAERIVAERSLRGGFSSPEELVVFCGVSVDRIALIRDRLVFQPM